MKALSIVLVSASSAVVASVATIALLPVPAAKAPGGVQPRVASSVVSPELDRAPSSLREPSQAEELEALSQRVGELEMRLARLASDRRQIPAEDDPVLAAAPMSAGAETVLATPQAREFVMDVLEQTRQQEEAQEQEARLQRIEERAASRAQELGVELGLAQRDQDALYGVLVEEGQRRESLFQSMRDGGFGPDTRDKMREGMRELQTWKTDELSVRLGPGLADQVLESERSRNDFGGFGRGRRGGDEGGGGGGDGGGRGGRGN